MKLIRHVAVSLIAVAFVATSPLTPPTTAAAQQTAESTVSAADVTPASGFFGWSGGVARALRARTQTTPSQIGSAGAWVGISGAIIAITVAAGTADTLDVSFTTECTKLLGGRARIRLIDTVSGVTSSFEPNDGDVALCTAAGPAVHHAEWIKRVGAGVHNLQVQVMNTAGLVVIDDWKMKVVVYD